MPELRIRKLANAFSHGAKPLLGGVAGAAVEQYQRRTGGVWVGGTVEVTTSEIAFTPNRINAALHANAPRDRVPMHQVVSVHRQFGWLTGIVVVVHKRGELRFRCFGAQGLVKQINSHLAQSGLLPPRHAAHGGEA
jgi:hypothetical protein